MKAIFIDAAKQEIRPVDYDPAGHGFPAIGDYLGGWIDAAFRWENGDVLYVDEEGYLKPSMHFFFCRFRPDQPMAGNGVVVGREVEHEDMPLGYYTEPPTCTVEWLQSQIVWMTRAGFDRWIDQHRNEPATTVTTIDQSGKRVTEILATYGDLAAAMGRKEAK